MSFVLDEEEFNFIWIQVSLFIDIHDWTEAKHSHKPVSTAAVIKGHMQLAVISVEVVWDSVSTDHTQEWSGMEGE